MRRIVGRDWGHYSILPFRRQSSQARGVFPLAAHQRVDEYESNANVHHLAFVFF
jgi:hypothetical protein